MFPHTDGILDMFPHTGDIHTAVSGHVETVCLLSQRKPDTAIEVDPDISELEVSSAETKATYEEIKSYVLKKYGLKVSNLYIAQVKRECGIVERINYNLPKTEGNRVPQCPEDKRKAIKDAFISFSDDLREKAVRNQIPAALFVKCHFFFASLSRAIVSSIALLMNTVVLSSIS